MRTKQYGIEAIDDESSNAGKDPDAATEAIPEGQARFAHALRQNLVREPDAGNPPVRFDERGWETEQGVTIEAPANESAGNR